MPDRDPVQEALDRLAVEDALKRLDAEEAPADDSDVEAMLTRAGVRLPDPKSTLSAVVKDPESPGGDSPVGKVPAGWRYMEGAAARGHEMRKRAADAFGRAPTTKREAAAAMDAMDVGEARSAYAKNFPGAPLNHLSDPKKAREYLDLVRSIPEFEHDRRAGLELTMRGLAQAAAKGASFNLVDPAKIGEAVGLERAEDFEAAIAEQRKRSTAYEIGEAAVGLAASAPQIGAMVKSGMSVPVALAAHGATATEGGVKERATAAARGYVMGAVAGPVAKGIGKMASRAPAIVREPLAGGVGFAAGGLAAGHDPKEAPGQFLLGAFTHLPGGIGKMRAEAAKPKVELVDVKAVPGEPANRARVEPAPEPAIETKPVGATAAVAEAPKAEPAPGVEPTSIKNKIVNAERADRGLGEMERPFRQTFQEVADKALASVKENPNRPREIMDALKSNMRAPTPVESAVLTIHRVNLRNDRARLDAEGIKAVAEGRPDAAAEAKAAADAKTAEFIELDDIGHRGGTEAGRSLNIRRMEMAQDYSLVAMEAARRRENDYKPLSDKQMAETRALHERLKSAIAERDTYRDRLAEVQARRAPSSTSRKAPPSPKSPEYGATNRLVTREAYEKIKAELRSKMSRMSAGIDPTFIADVVKLGAFHVEAGARSFGTWAKAMVEDLGDDVKPHLRDVWNESRRRVPVEQPTELPRTKEAIANEARVETARREWHEALVRDRLKKQSLVKKIARGVFVETPNTARALMTSMDLSAVLRQGGFIGLGHPIRATKAMGPMFRSLVSRKWHAEAEADLSLRPNYHKAKQSGLYLSEHGASTLSKMEEAYMSRWATKPIEIRGRDINPVAASQRAYTAFLNRLRMDSFDAMAASLSRTGTPTPKEAKAIAAYINAATGRGSLGSHDATLATLNTVFFSPRNLVSRFQILAGPFTGFQTVGGGSLRTRKMIASEYARFAVGVSTVYALGLLAGGEIERDTRSADAGKLKFGNTRLDVGAGFLQAVTLASRHGTGETKSTKGGRVAPLKDVGYGKDDLFDVTATYFRNKLAPVPGAYFDVRTGEKSFGQKVTLGSAARELVTPMSFSEIKEAADELGVPAGVVLGTLSILGMGLQTHGPKEE